MEYKTLRRPPADATPDQVAAYHRAVAAALTELGVDYGDDFNLSAVKARARRTDPTPSHDAAASTGPLRENQKAVLHILRRYGPHTDEQMVELYQSQRALLGLPKQSSSGLRTRRKELVGRGLVADSGTKRPMRSGRKATVWQVVDG